MNLASAVNLLAGHYECHNHHRCRICKYLCFIVYEKAPNKYERHAVKVCRHHQLWNIRKKTEGQDKVFIFDVLGFQNRSELRGSCSSDLVDLILLFSNRLANYNKLIFKDYKLNSTTYYQSNRTAVHDEMEVYSHKANKTRDMRLLKPTKPRQFLKHSFA